MRISTRARYALRAMVELALHFQEGPIPRAEIAARQRISEDYIAHLFQRLEKDGLVRSKRGRMGGYVLAREPARIYVGDIVRSVEGPIALTDCTRVGQETDCPLAYRCVTRRVWLRTAQAMAETLDSITLADLCAEAQSLPEVS